MVVRAQEPGALVGGASELATSFETLERELRLLCRGVAFSRLRHLGAVSTTVRLPDDVVQVLALRWLCDDLAEEFGLATTIRQGDEGWAVRFSRSPVAGDVSPAERVRVVERAARGLRAGLEGARLFARSLRWGMKIADARHRAGRVPARRAAE